MNSAVSYRGLVSLWLVPMTYGEMKTKSAKSTMKNADPGIHQRSPTRRAKPMTTSTASAEEDELHAEREPAAEDHLRDSRRA